MNKYLINELKADTAFSEDSFILENLFFLPKELPLQNYHLKLLNEWNITEIFTEGSVSQKALEKIKNPEVNEEENNNPVKTDKEATEQPKETAVQNDLPKTSAILDNTISGFIESYKRWIKETINFFNAIVSRKEPDKVKVDKMVSEICSLTKSNKNNALLIFGRKFENISYYIPQAIENVILTYILGSGLNMNVVTLSNLTISALFHDIGMTKVPKEIIDKHDKLSVEEFNVIKNHTITGYKMLLDMKFSPIIASGALQHHERLDGKGYPNAQTQNKITDIAKIIAVSDVYCAAISSKPYKESPMHAKQIIQELLRSGGTSFSSVVIKELIKNISFYPIGSLIVLSNDLIAKVVGSSGAPMKPIIKIVNKDDSGEVIDLSSREDLYIKDLYKKES